MKIKKQPGGWGWPFNASKSHYFNEGDVRSVCGGWLFAGEREPDEFASADDCSKCRKHLEDAKTPKTESTMVTRAKDLDHALKYNRTGAAALPRMAKKRGSVGVQD